MTVHELIHPAGGRIEPPATAGKVVDRLRKLDRATVVLFSNNKPNVDVFYDELARLLTRSGLAKEVQREIKLSSAFPAQPGDIVHATHSAQLAINAMGD